MPKVTTICYLISLIFYGMGYSKMKVINNPITHQITTYDFTLYASLATVYFVLTIFFAVIGSLGLYIRYNRGKFVSIKDTKLKEDRRLDRWGSLPEPKTQLEKPKYALNVYRRIS